MCMFCFVYIGTPEYMTLSQIANEVCDWEWNKLKILSLKNYNTQNVIVK